MANARLSGFTPSLPLGLSGSTGPAANNGGYVRSSNADWATAKAGASESATSDNLSIKAAPGFVLERSFLQFEIPDNLARLDDNPQLTLYVDSTSGDTKVFVTSISYGSNFKTPWSNTTAASAWDSVQLATSAAYYSEGSSFYATLASGLNTLTLDANNGLAKFHCLTGGTVTSGLKFITIALVNFLYDQQDNDSFSSTNSVALAAPSHANAPTLVLRKPWFVDDRGNEFPVDGDYTIRAFDVGVNQRDRSVPQLPFSTAIKGPAFLRGKNSSYKVTS